MDEHAQDPRGYFVWRSSETGKFVPQAFAKRNPSTTARDWIKLDDEPEKDPDIEAVLHALKGAKTAEDYDVAEFILDANEAIGRLYKNIMRGRER